MTGQPDPPSDLNAEIRALLAERRARLYGRDRFTAAGRRAAWRIARELDTRSL